MEKNEKNEVKNKGYKGYKFRMFPTDEQIKAIENNFNCTRFVYNYFLEKRIEAYKEDKSYISRFECGKQLTQLKKDETWLRTGDSTAQVYELINLESAYKNFFRDPKIGFPKFKSRKNSEASYTTRFADTKDNYLKLPKIGFIRYDGHREIPKGYTPKSVTISRKCDKYYCSILCEYEMKVSPQTVSEQNVIGLKFDMDSLYIDSNGEYGNMPKFYNLSLPKLQRRQRKLSSKVKDSNNYMKAKNALAKVHMHIYNQRKDFLHKKSTEIANRYDMICIEDISISEIVKSNGSEEYRQSVLDNGWGDFITMLTYKMHDRGKPIIRANGDTATEIRDNGYAAYVAK